MNNVDLNKASGMSKASLILGICALIPFVGWALGLAAIIIGIIDLIKIKNKEAGEPGKKFDIMGIIFGVVFPWIFSMIIISVITSAAMGALSNIAY
jgi:hypothetical protein